VKLEKKGISEIFFFYFFVLVFVDFMFPLGFRGRVQYSGKKMEGEGRKIQS